MKRECDTCAFGHRKDMNWPCAPCETGQPYKGWVPYGVLLVVEERVV